MRFLSAAFLLALCLSCNKEAGEVKYGKVAEEAGPWTYKTPSSKSLALNVEVMSLAGFPGDFSGNDGFGSYASFASAYSATTDGTYIYVIEASAIRRVDPLTEEVVTIAGDPGAGGSLDGIGDAALLENTMMTTSDGQYVYFNQLYCVRSMNIATRSVETVAGNCAVGAYLDGVGTAARFSGLMGIATDGVSLYVSDDSLTIRKIDIATKQVTTFAGANTLGGYSDGVGTAARLGLMGALALDEKFLYMGDYQNNLIRKIDLTTRYVKTIAGDGSEPSGHVDGVGRYARFTDPFALTVDKDNIYVAGNGCAIRKINKATSMVTTIAGASGTCGASTNGIGLAARFTGIYSLVNDGKNLFVLESYVLRKIK